MGIYGKRIFSDAFLRSTVVSFGDAASIWHPESFKRILDSEGLQENNQ
jgi:hypothetical protein